MIYIEFVDEAGSFADDLKTLWKADWVLALYGTPVALVFAAAIFSLLLPSYILDRAGNFLSEVGEFLLAPCNQAVRRYRS